MHHEVTRNVVCFTAESQPYKPMSDTWHSVNVCWMGRCIDECMEDKCLAEKIIVLYPFVCTNYSHPPLDSVRLFSLESLLIRLNS